jgi:hypothetical protein
MSEQFQITTDGPSDDEFELYDTYESALEALALYAGRNLQSGDAVAFENEHTLHLFLHEYGPDPRRREHYTLRVERVIETVDLETAVQQAGSALPYSARFAPQHRYVDESYSGGQCNCQRCVYITQLTHIARQLGTTVADEFGAITPDMTIGDIRVMLTNLQRRLRERRMEIKAASEVA